MDFVSKALGSLNIGLPFSLGEEIGLNHTHPYKLFSGNLRKDGRKISVFDFTDKSTKYATRTSEILKSIDLLGVVGYIDTVLSGKHVYILTDAVVPVNFKKNSVDMNRFIVYCIWHALISLHNSGINHNAICLDSIMMNELTGEPVLTGFEFATSNSDVIDPEVAMFYPGITPPDGWTSPTLDTYQFGLLLKQVLPDEKVMIAGLTASRRPVLSDKLRSMPSNKFTSNELTMLLDSLNAAVNQSKDRLTQICERILELKDEFDLIFMTRKLLPVLFQTNNVATLHTCLILISSLDKNKELSQDDPILQYLITQFACLDRVVRLELLTQLPNYIDLIPKPVIQSKIMPKMAFGFTDSNEMVKRVSISSVKTLLPKMTSRQINFDLLKLLAKTHNDSNPEVRALTTTLLCQIASNLSNHSVISTALGRALKDPEPKCRDAALQGVLMIDFAEVEIADKILGPAAFGILDKNQDVAAQAWRVTDLLLEKIKAASVAEGAAPPQSTVDTNSLEIGADNKRMQGVVPPVGGVVGESHTTNTNNRTAVQEEEVLDTFEIPEDEKLEDGAWDWEQKSEDEPIDVDDDAWGW